METKLNKYVKIVEMSIVTRTTLIGHVGHILLLGEVKSGGVVVRQIKTSQGASLKDINVETRIYLVVMKVVKMIKS